MTVLFDVDGTLLGNAGRVRPGTDLLLDVISELGHEIHLWSSAGVSHALEAGRKLNIPGHQCHAKPARPIHPAEALARLNMTEPPALTVDNDPSHVVPGWDTLIVESWWR